ncbi:MAG: allantoinase PuuE, partial [Pseudomonadota bacterium]
MTRYKRDLRGYGPHPPDAAWPNGAAIAVQFVLNYEEGGERCLLHGDSESEAFLSDIPGAAAWPDQRHWNMEQHYDYGARAGFWRLHRLFTDRAAPLTVFGVASALARSPEQVAAMRDAGWEIASHGLRWIDYRDMSEADEAREMDAAIALHAAVVGAQPTGWYTGRCSMNTVALSAARAFAWISDSYADDMPYWIEAHGRDQLVIPYTLDANDMRFAVAEGFDTGAQFFSYLQDAFDVLLAEGRGGAAKMMSVGLHCRLAGRPGRAAALARFIDYVQSHDDAWIARRIDIADHWRAVHPPRRPSLTPSAMTKDAFVAAFGGVFEHSPWIAERAFALELG